MGFKTITVNEESKCTDCGGTSGIRYCIVLSKIPCVIKWGGTTPEPEIKETSYFVSRRKQPKTAKCIDCGKRVNFKVNVPTCYECGKPRGKEENGDFVCPCPECGNEDPF